MYKYIQQDATVLSWLLFLKKTQHASGFHHAHHQEYITA
jgi:hypothetical protein